MRSRCVNIVRDFSRLPGGRYQADGHASAELCRKVLLAPALQSNELVIVQLDGTVGYAASFLEELFGGLIREEGFDASTLKARLSLESADPRLVQEIWEYISDADGARE